MKKSAYLCHRLQITAVCSARLAARQLAEKSYSRLASGIKRQHFIGIKSKRLPLSVNRLCHPGSRDL